MMPKVPDSSYPYSEFYIGIDPGLSGGLVCISVGNEPSIQIKQMPEDWELAEWFRKVGIIGGDGRNSFYGIRHAVIEKVASSPQMGVSSAFTFGCGYGKLLMGLTSNNIPFEEIRPQVWQKALGIAKRKKDEPKPELKLRLLKKAQQLYPDLPLWSEPKSKGRQLAICDALLIATYCQRKVRGTL